MNAGRHAKPGCMGLLAGAGLLVVLVASPLVLVGCTPATPSTNPTATTIDIGDLANAEICSQARHAIATTTLNDPQVGVDLVALANKRAVDPGLAQAVVKYYAALDAQRDPVAITTSCDRLGR